MKSVAVLGLGSHRAHDRGGRRRAEPPTSRPRSMAPSTVPTLGAGPHFRRDPPGDRPGPDQRRGHRASRWCTARGRRPRPGHTRTRWVYIRRPGPLSSSPRRGVAYPPGGGPPNRQDCPPSAGTVRRGSGASLRHEIQSETFVQRACRGTDGVSLFLSPSGRRRVRERGAYEQRQDVRTHGGSGRPVRPGRAAARRLPGVRCSPSSSAGSSTS